MFFFSLFLVSINFWFLSRTFSWFDISLAFNVLVNHLNIESLNYFDLNKMLFIFIFFCSAFEDGDRRKLWFNKWIKFESFYSMIESSLYLIRTHTHLHFECIYLSIELLSICIVFQYSSLIEISYAVAPHSLVGIVCLCVRVSVCVRTFFVNLTVWKRLLSIHRESIARN